MAEGEEKTVRQLHNEAMQKYMDAFVAEHTEKCNSWQRLPDKAYVLYSEAYYLEVDAAAKVACLPENEPTYSILWRSVASIALKLDWRHAAMDAADAALLGTPRPDEYEFLKAVSQNRVDPNNYDRWDWEKNCLRKEEHV